MIWLMFLKSPILLTSFKKVVFQTEAWFKLTDRPTSFVHFRLQSENSNCNTDAERWRDKTRVPDRASERSRTATCDLEFTANMSVCWNPSEPSLPLILLWIIKHPHLTRSPPSPSSFLLLSYIHSPVFILVLNVLDVPLPASFILPFCLFITVWMGFMSYHEAAKTRGVPPGIRLSESTEDWGGHIVWCVSFNFSF